MNLYEQYRANLCSHARFSPSLWCDMTWWYCRFKCALTRFKENFPEMNVSAGDFTQVIPHSVGRPVPGPGVGWWSHYRHFYFMSSKKFYIALQFTPDLTPSTNKCSFFNSNLMSRSKLFSAHFLIRLGNWRTLERRAPTIPIDWSGLSNAQV